MWRVQLPIGMQPVVWHRPGGDGHTGRNRCTLDAYQSGLVVRVGPAKEAGHNVIVARRAAKGPHRVYDRINVPLLDSVDLHRVCRSRLEPFGIGHELPRHGWAVSHETYLQPNVFLKLRPANCDGPKEGLYYIGVRSQFRAAYA